MAEFSDFYENKIIDHMLRAVAYTVPSTVYVALFTGSGGLEANNPTLEVSGGAYARLACVLATAVAGTSYNSAELAFATATANWGTLSHVAIVDHLSNVAWGTNVNALMWSPMDATKTIEISDQFKINAGDLDISVA